MEFNNREISIGIWLFILVVYLFKKDKDHNIKRSILSFCKVLLNKKIIIGLSVMVFYVLLEIVFLYKIKIWNINHIKDTIYWVIGIGFIQFINVNEALNNSGYFKKAIKNILEITIVLEFIVHFYSFNLLIEIILVPILFFAVMMIAYTESYTWKYGEKYNHVNKVLNIVLGMFSIIVLLISIYKTINDSENFYTIDILLELITPVLLSLLFVPFLYFTYLYMKIEQKNIYKKINNM